MVFSMIDNDKPKKVKISDKHLLVLLSALCVTLLILSHLFDISKEPFNSLNEYVFLPIQHGIGQIGEFAGKRIDTIKKLKDLQAENSRLRSEIDELNVENTQLHQAKVEYDRLKELYEMDKSLPSYTKIEANIVSKAAGNWFDYFTIDKGKNDGIEKDMNVIAGAGLVGIVTEVGRNYSKVMSIINDASNVKGMTLSTSSQCLIVGDLSLLDKGYIHILQLSDPKNKIFEGEKIVTSNISTKYMPGILIGYISKLEKEPNQLLKSGYIVPAVDFTALNEVLVITEQKETWNSREEAK